MDRNVDLVHARLLRLYDRAVEVGREGVGLAGEVAGEVLTRQVGLVGVGAAVIAEALDSPVGEGGVSVGRGHAAEAESVVGHDLAVLVDLEIEGVKGRGNDAVPVRGHVLHEHLPVVRRAVGLGAVIAAAELVLGVKDLDGVVAVNQLERVDAVVGYQQHVAIDCGIIQSVALVRGEGDGDVLVLGGKNMACNLAAVEGGGAVMDRNVDLVHVRLLRLGGLALDLAGDGGSASDFPSIVAGVPDQNELLALIFILMRGLSRRIIGAENLTIVRHDGANVLFATLINIISADGSLQIEGLGIPHVINIFIDALEDYCELAKFRVIRVTGLFRLRVVVNLGVNDGFVIIIAVVCTKGGVVTGNNGGVVGEAAIGYIVSGKGFCNINNSDSGTVYGALKAISIDHSGVFIGYVVSSSGIAEYADLIHESDAAILRNGNSFPNVRYSDAFNTGRGNVGSSDQFFGHTVQLFAYTQFNNDVVLNFSYRELRHRYELTIVASVKLAVYCNTGDVCYFHPVIVVFRDNFDGVTAHIIYVIIAALVLPLVFCIYGIGIAYRSVYGYIFYCKALYAIICVVGTVIVISNLNGQCIATLVGGTHDMVLLCMTSAGGALGCVDVHVAVNICIAVNTGSAVFFSLPAKKNVAADRRIVGHLIAYLLTVLNVNRVIQTIRRLIV